ncbi:hypothetical protein [Roseovarius sp. Pro17]|uniref:hypothetical protein n=1 Tax=Roseovarius sp. Pro17 TaxID=3108175 RepID=UPI002D796B35|nr:hypothetical protein [Roseovarius sp. Pro17]
MIGALSVLWLASLLGWLAFALLGFGMQPQMAVPLGLIFGLGCAFLLRDTVPLRGIVALLGPVGAVLPFIILRQMTAHLGVPVQPFGSVELLVFLVLYTAFLASAAGVMPVDVYRLGYAPIPVALMVLTLCAYGFAQGMVFVPLLAVTGQAMWLAGWGSSNYFDHVLHPALAPAVAVVLVLRLF